MKRTTSEAEQLRNEIGERASNRGRLPRVVRERAKAFVKTRAGAGFSSAMIAAELGLSVKTIERWRVAESAGALVPVRVVAARPAPTRIDRVVVVTTGGLRIEGLDIDALCTLVSRCG